MSETLLRNRFGTTEDGSSESAETRHISTTSSAEVFPPHMKGNTSPVQMDLEGQPQPTTEEVLIQRLDIFLSSIEKRLERFEQYFKVIGSEEAVDDEDGDKEYLKPNHSRRGSTASTSSMTSIRQISVSHLNKVYTQLDKVKESVLSNSFKNVEFLYKTLDDQYNYMFNVKTLEDEGEEIDRMAEAQGAGFPGLARKEAIQNRVIDILHYFEEKLVHIDNFLSVKAGAVDEDEALRFYNFNKALKQSEQGYLHYFQLPLAWRENKYIIEGYRFTFDHGDMLKSIFHFNHNETGNIWTHMFGLFIVAWLAFYHFPRTTVFAANSVVDNCIMYLFFVASAKCLVSSVLWHTYSCFAHEKIRSRFACVDYTGITTLITCSVVSAEYCALYHMPKSLTFFVIMSVLAGLGSLTFNWSPFFDKHEFRHLRIAFFVSLAVLGGTTFFIKWFYEGFYTTLYFYLPITYKSFSWYWLGVLFYAGLIPERWRYDVIINQDASCKHTHTPSDVFTGFEDAGDEELEDLEHELEDVARDSRDKSQTTSQMEKETLRVIEKHFPAQPPRTPYHRDFLSLWWVDYIGSSHNLWHLFVVGGIVGHYYSLVGMFDAIVR